MPINIKCHKKDRYVGTPYPLKIRFVEPKPGQSLKDAVAETRFALNLWFDVCRAMGDVAMQQLDFMQSLDDCMEDDIEQFQAALEILRGAKLELEKGYPLIEYMEVERRYTSYLDSDELQSLPNYEAPVMQYKHHTYLNSNEDKTYARKLEELLPTVSMSEFLRTYH